MTTAILHRSSTPSPRHAGRDREDRSGAEKALGRERRRHDARFADESGGLQRSARFASPKHRDSFPKSRRTTPAAPSSSARIRARRRTGSRRGSARIATSAARAANRFARNSSHFCWKGPPRRLLPNIVFSQLDSDLPFYLWWQGEFHDPMDPQLWAWVDRVIYDSQAWSDFRAQMQRVETAQADAKQRIVLCDLNWTRLVQFRLARRAILRSPRVAARLTKSKASRSISRRSIDRRRSCWQDGSPRSCIGQSRKRRRAMRWLFAIEARKTIQVSLREKAGEPISRCAVHCGSLEFRVAHAAKRRPARRGRGTNEELPDAGRAERLGAPDERRTHARRPASRLSPRDELRAGFIVARRSDDRRILTFLSRRLPRRGQ